jgi:hypothetical protein
MCVLFFQFSHVALEVAITHKRILANPGNPGYKTNREVEKSKNLLAKYNNFKRRKLKTNCPSPPKIWAIFLKNSLKM